MRKSAVFTYLLVGVFTAASGCGIQGFDKAEGDAAPSAALAPVSSPSAARA